MSPLALQSLVCFGSRRGSGCSWRGTRQKQFAGVGMVQQILRLDVHIDMLSLFLVSGVLYFLSSIQKEALKPLCV
jgi:hypothetical protein